MIGLLPSFSFGTSLSTARAYSPTTSRTVNQVVQPYQSPTETSGHSLGKRAAAPAPAPVTPVNPAPAETAQIPPAPSPSPPPPQAPSAAAATGWPDSPLDPPTTTTRATGEAEVRGSGPSTALIVGGVAVAGLVAFLVLRKRGR